MEYDEVRRVCATQAGGWTTGPWRCAAARIVTIATGPSCSAQPRGLGYKQINNLEIEHPACNQLSDGKQVMNHDSPKTRLNNSAHIFVSLYHRDTHCTHHRCATLVRRDGLHDVSTAENASITRNLTLTKRG
jgi:hypothetical protein